MELWIRSQDKTRLAKITQVKFVDKESDLDDFENVIRGYGIDGYNFRLGIYKTKERALEVLDEIQRILHPIIKSYTPLTESKEDYKNHCMKTELVGYETTYDIVALPTYVYEMPKE